MKYNSLSSCRLDGVGTVAADIAKESQLDVGLVFCLVLNQL